MDEMRGDDGGPQINDYRASAQPSNRKNNRGPVVGTYGQKVRDGQEIKRLMDGRRVSKKITLTAS